MADYRDLAAALGGGYGQDTGPITPDTLLTLKNGKTASAGDLLGLLKGYGQAVGSNLESLGRGGVASVIGAGGDLESLGRMGINKLYGAGGVNVNPTPVLPTTTDILGMMPRATVPRPETAGMEELGGYMTPATAKLAGKAIKATEGLPVGMSIKDVGKGIASNTSQFTGFKNTTPYGKAKEVAAYLDKLNVPYTINKSKTTNSAYLEIQTGKGDFDYPMQFRFSDHSTDLPHQNRQIFTNPKPDPNFDLDMFKDGGHDTDFAISKINDLMAKVKPKTVI